MSLISPLATAGIPNIVAETSAKNRPIVSTAVSCMFNFATLFF